MRCVSPYNIQSEQASKTRWNRVFPLRQNLVRDGFNQLRLLALSLYNVGGAWRHGLPLEQDPGCSSCLHLTLLLVVRFDSLEEFFAAARWVDVLDANVDPLLHDTISGTCACVERFESSRYVDQYAVRLQTFKHRHVSFFEPVEGPSSSYPIGLLRMTPTALLVTLNIFPVLPW